MARGRSIDKALPPTRALTQQRDYRARKAARIEQLEHDKAVLVAENERLRAEMDLMVEKAAHDLRMAREEQEDKVEAARREVAIAWNRVGKEQEKQEVACGPSCRANGGGSGGKNEQTDHNQQTDRAIHHSRSSYPRSPSQYEQNPPSPPKQISTVPRASYHYPTPPTPTHRSIPIMQQQAPYVDKPPFDPDCCSGLFDCDALSAIPPFPPDTGRTDFDLLVDVATHVTEPGIQRR